MKLYKCDDGWVNCRRGNEKEYTYTKIVPRDTGTEYQYADQGGYAVRTSSNGTGEQKTTVAGAGESEENIVKDSDDAQLGAQACSNANLKSGKEWAFPGAIGVSRYYEHSGFLCSESGGAALKIAEQKLIGYTCNSGGWQSCKRNKSYDADLIYPAEDYKWGKRMFLKLKMKWSGYGERELYIEKK